MLEVICIIVLNQFTDLPGSLGFERDALILLYRRGTGNQATLDCTLPI